jgi:2',3'-cyclic-nucleotide 2'-phosphodiesterase/3'-nucleotidase
MKSIKTLILFLLLIITSGEITGQTVNLKIIATSDVHGAIFPYDLINDRKSSGSLAQAMTYLDQERNKSNQEVILLDNGDILQGQPTVYYYNFEKPDTTHLLASVMNYMKYDAATIGNHDIETGHDVYDKFTREINFPWLAANAVDINTGAPYFKPYTIIERKGIKVAVLGLITPAIPRWLPPVIYEGIFFDDMIETAKLWVKKIRAEEQPDILIGLFHSGVEWNYGGQTSEDKFNENASQLIAERVDGFDVIFVGHDHHGWNYTVKGPEGNDVLIVGPLSGAKTLAVANFTLSFDKSCELWNSKATGEIIEVKNYEPDANFLSKFNPFLEEVKKYVSRPIGKLTNAIDTREALFGPSSFTDLVNRLQLDISGADISFTDPQSINLVINEGNIYVRDLFKIYRYENLLYTMELTGKEIDAYLEFSNGNWYNQMSSETDHILRFRKDSSGNIIFSERNEIPELEERFYNFSSAAGINYTVDITKPFGERVEISSLSTGEQFSFDNKYKVAVNSYRGNGGGEHLTLGSGIPQKELSKRIVSSTERDLRFYIMKWIEEQREVTPLLLNNWKVVPEEWWRKAIERDFNLIFN